MVLYFFAVRTRVADSTATSAKHITCSNKVCYRARGCAGECLSWGHIIWRRTELFSYMLPSVHVGKTSVTASAPPLGSCVVLCYCFGEGNQDLRCPGNCYRICDERERYWIIAEHV